MDPDTPVTHDRRPGRAGRLLRLLTAIGVGLFMVFAFAPSASAAEVNSLSVSGAKAGQHGDLWVTLAGPGCKGTRVTVGFQGGQHASVKATSCVVHATVTIPNPASCHNGSGTVTAYASVGSSTQTIAKPVKCLKKHTSKPPKKPSKSPSPTSTPKPTHTKKPSTHPPSHSPKASSHAPSKSPTPSKTAPAPSPSSTAPTPSSTNTSAVNPLLPPDDGGPQAPGGGGLTGPGSLTAVALIAIGGAVGLLLWQRGAGLPTLAAVLGGALVLAAAAAVVPSALGHQQGTARTPVVQAATAQVTVPAGKSSSATAHCQAGTVVVGGGAQTTGSRDVSLSASAPTGSGWSATATAPPGGKITLTAVAVCATDLAAPTSQSDGPYPVDSVQAQRTQARCGGAQPLVVGWRLPNGEPMAVLPLASGGSVTAYATPSGSGSAVVLCAGSGYPNVQRTASQPVQLAAGQAGRAVAGCPAGTVVVGGGYLPVSPADGRLAEVSVQSAAPVDGGYQVTARAAVGDQGANLNAYALCLGSAAH